MNALGALFILLGFLVAVGGLVCAVWAIVHAATRSGAQFRAAGQNRAVWLALILVGFFLQPLGMILAIVYVAAIRPKVDRATPLLPFMP